MGNDLPPGVVAVPAQRRMWTRTTVALLRLRQELPARCEFFFNIGTTFLPVKRNDAARRLLQEAERRWVLYLDSDMTPPARVVHRLWETAEEADADLVQAAMVAKDGGHVPVGARVMDREPPSDPLRPFSSANSSVRSPVAEHVAEGTEPIALDVAGTGCLLVRRRVFEELEGPWFVANEEGYHEDWNFTLRATDAGFRCVLDPTVEVGHVGCYAYGLDDAVRAERERTSNAVAALENLERQLPWGAGRRESGRLWI